MTTHKATTIVGKGGKIILEDLPFTEGVEVEVTLTTTSKDDRPWPPEFPLEGSVIRYDDPFDPACPPEEWEALN